ncbi:MAG: hypothetical protein J3Q66DRAFT_415520 [Benniella sp.]|nr:MAG: hypothetical protein J3Q66DRAFT_415520 [Benniella sp.]
MRSFSWERMSLFTPRFVELISARTWPHLQGLSASSYDDNSDLSKVIGAMQRIADLKVRKYSFYIRADGSLRPHLSNLQTLDLYEAIAFTSELAQEVMSSCPLLTVFKGCIVDAVDIVQGRPWVCLQLKLLSLGFRFDSTTFDQMHPLVLDQLSRLTRLEDLELYSWRQSPSQFQETIDLRLEHGLGKLSTLRLLRILEIGAAKQRMGLQEIDWMIEHWKCLVRIYGKLNVVEAEVEKTLGERLRQRGIANY